MGTTEPTTIAFNDIDPSVGQLWLQQVLADRFGFRIGKYYPLDAYDFFPLKNFRMDFVDGVQSANLVIPLPDRGLGGFAEYRPEPNIYVRVGLHEVAARARRREVSLVEPGIRNVGDATVRSP